jgi:hypothetical protein
VKWVPDQKDSFQITIFLLEYPLWRVPSVFTTMQIKRKHPRTSRLMVDRRSPAPAAIISNSNLTTSGDAARQTAAPTAQTLRRRVKSSRVP